MKILLFTCFRGPTEQPETAQAKQPGKATALSPTDSLEKPAVAQAAPAAPSAPERPPVIIPKSASTGAIEKPRPALPKSASAGSLIRTSLSRLSITKLPPMDPETGLPVTPQSIHACDAFVRREFNRQHHDLDHTLHALFDGKKGVTFVAPHNPWDSDD